MKTRGAKPTPRAKLLAAQPHQALIAAPQQFAVVPTQLSMWGNADYGDCVTAEEAYAKAAYSIMSGSPELFVSEATAIAWAKKHNYLNGAYLTEVMDTMKTDGLSVNNVNYKNGNYSGVDFSNEVILQSAIATGPVKIGIDADALPTAAGDHNGWFTITKGNFGNEDHCVCLTGYGSASYLYSVLGVALPNGLSGNEFGYLLFTWSTVGFVTHAWLMGTCGEAWVRNPTTVGQAPPVVPPVVPPVPPGPGPSVLHGTTIPTKMTIQVPSGVLGHMNSVSFTIPALAVTVNAGATGDLQSALEEAFKDEQVLAAMSRPEAQVGGTGAIVLKIILAVVPVVTADLAAGKTFAQMVPDIVSAILAALVG